MLPKNLRIKLRDFNKNPQRFTKIVSPSFNLFIKSGKEKLAKFVISVPKAVDKRSSLRHKTKRILEQAILSFKENTNTNKEILIRVKELITSSNRKRVESDLKKLLQNEIN